MTGNKLMAESIRGEEGKIRSAWICLTCLTGEDPPGDHCKGLLLRFGEFSLFLGRSHLLIPKEVLCRKNFSGDEMKLDGSSSSCCQFYDLT